MCCALLRPRRRLLYIQLMGMWDSARTATRKQHEAERKLKMAEDELRLLRRTLQLLTTDGTLPENFAAVVADYCKSGYTSILRRAVEQHLGGIV